MENSATPIGRERPRKTIDQTIKRYLEVNGTSFNLL